MVFHQTEFVLAWFDTDFGRPHGSRPTRHAQAFTDNHFCVTHQLQLHSFWAVEVRFNRREELLASHLKSCNANVLPVAANRMKKSGKMRWRREAREDMDLGIWQQCRGELDGTFQIAAGITSTQLLEVGSGFRDTRGRTGNHGCAQTCPHNHHTPSTREKLFCLEQRRLKTAGFDIIGTHHRAGIEHNRNIAPWKLEPWCGCAQAGCDHG